MSYPVNVSSCEESSREGGDEGNLEGNLNEEPDDGRPRMRYKPFANHSLIITRWALSRSRPLARGG